MLIFFKLLSFPIHNFLISALCYPFCLTLSFSLTFLSIFHALQPFLLHFNITFFTCWCWQLFHPFFPLFYSYDYVAQLPTTVVMETIICLDVEHTIGTSKLTSYCHNFCVNDEKKNFFQCDEFSYFLNTCLIALVLLQLEKLFIIFTHHHICFVKRNWKLLFYFLFVWDSSDEKEKKL